MSVHRLTPLPRGVARGRLLVCAAVLPSTRDRLRNSRGDDGRHEDLVLWAGRTVGNDVLVAAALFPETSHGWGFVSLTEKATGAAARAGRRHGLAVLAQVHSHPGSDTRHSDGDDKLVLMPFEGMFSLVVGHYGDGSVMPSEGAGLHQFQDGRWIQVIDATEALIVIPEAIDV